MGDEEILQVKHIRVKMTLKANADWCVHAQALP